MKYVNLFPRFAALTLCSQLMMGCLAGNNQEFFQNAQQINTLLLANASPTPTPAPVICDPLSKANQSDSSLGIQASLYYLDNYVVGGAYPVTSSDEFLTQGTKVDADLFLSDLNVTPENFTAGFQYSSGNYFNKPNGDLLMEWFSIRGSSNIQLATADHDGYYQFATISDDGISFAIQDPNSSNWTTLINHQVEHSAALDCSTQPIHLVHGQKMPMSFTYYQGPRVRIAMMLMWREVDPSQFPLANCSTSPSDDYYFNGNSIPSTPLAPYIALQNQGWKPLAPENFALTTGTVNRCALGE